MNEKLKTGSNKITYGISQGTCLNTAYNSRSKKSGKRCFIDLRNKMVYLIYKIKCKLPTQY